MDFKICKFDPGLKDIKLESGMYTEAANKGMDFLPFLENYIVEKGCQPTEYHKLGLTTNLEKNMYRQYLAKQGKPIPPDALEMMMYVKGVKAFGAHTDIVSKIWSSNIQTLWPAYISSQIYHALIASAPITDFVAKIEIIDGENFKKVYIEDTEWKRSMKRGTPDAEAPLIVVKVSEQEIPLKKHWLQWKMAYEEINARPLGLYNVFLADVGLQLAVDRFDDLMYTFCQGDGNSNGLSASYTKTTATSGSISKKDIITLACSVPSPYTARRGVGTTTEMIKYWDALSDLINPKVQKDEIGIPLPYMTRWDSYMGGVADRLYTVDSERALIYVTNDTALLTETDKLIARQQVKTVVSERGAFGIIQQKALGCLDVTH